MSVSDLWESFLIPGSWPESVGKKKGKQAFGCGGFPRLGQHGQLEVWDLYLRSSWSFCHHLLRLHE